MPHGQGQTLRRLRKLSLISLFRCRAACVHTSTCGTCRAVPLRCRTRAAMHGWSGAHVAAAGERNAMGSKRQAVDQNQARPCDCRWRPGGINACTNAVAAGKALRSHPSRYVPQFWLAGCFGGRRYHETPARSPARTSALHQPEAPRQRSEPAPSAGRGSSTTGDRAAEMAAAEDGGGRTAEAGGTRERPKGIALPRHGGRECVYFRAKARYGGWGAPSMR